MLSNKPWCTIYLKYYLFIISYILIKIRNRKKKVLTNAILLIGFFLITKCVFPCRGLISSDVINNINEIRPINIIKSFIDRLMFIFYSLLFDLHGVLLSTCSFIIWLHHDSLLTYQSTVF